MQEPAAEPGHRPAHQQFAGVDLRRPKGYAAPAAAAAKEPVVGDAEGDPCPRCESRDTKFCYYNNYNTSQPRHFCKGCRRYWTKGGTLRNVPVGGGTRKKPSSSSSSPSSYAANSDKPKKPSKKKRRVVVVVAAAPEPADATTVAADTAKAATNETGTTASAMAAAATPTTTTDAASEITTDLVVPAAAAAAEEEDSLAHLLQQPDVALGLGISEFPSGKELLDVEPDSFEWPAAFDLSTCWGSAGGFGDPDPAGLFLNLP